MRSWKSLLSILISAIATGDDDAQTWQWINGGKEAGREARDWGDARKVPVALMARQAHVTTLRVAFAS